MDWIGIALVAAGAIGGALIGSRMRPDKRRRVARRVLAAGVVLVVVTVSVALLR